MTAYLISSVDLSKQLEPPLKPFTKILFVITCLSTGGAERALFNVLTGGLARRFDTAVISLRDQGTIGSSIQKLGIPVHPLGLRNSFPSFGAIKELRERVKEFDPNIVQGWMYHGNLAATLAARIAPMRPVLVWNVRQSLYGLSAEKPLTRQIIRANRFLSRRVDGIIYNSRLSRQQHEKFGFAKFPGKIIPNGFDLERLRPDRETGQAVRQELGLPADAIIVGHVARYHPMKDHASFLRAAVQVVRKDPRVRFLVVGREVNLENPALVGIVPPKFEGRFQFMGVRDDVADLMRAMDVFCQSSWSEAFPNVLGEAMALGVPCVTTDVGDSQDIVGVTGVVVPPSDSAALANGLLAMVERSPEERANLGSAGRERIEGRYALPRVVEQYRGLYEQLLPDLVRLG